MGPYGYHYIPDHYYKLALLLVLATIKLNEFITLNVELISKFEIYLTTIDYQYQIINGKMQIRLHLQLKLY